MNEEKPNKKSNSVAFPQEKSAAQKKLIASGFGDRISEAAKRIGTRKTAAMSMDVATDSLARYIREEHSPSFLSVVGLSDASGIPLTWFAKGGEIDAVAEPKPSYNGNKDERINTYGKDMTRIREHIVSAAKESGYMPDIGDSKELGALRHALDTLMYVHNVPYKSIVQLLAIIADERKTL